MRKGTEIELTLEKFADRGKSLARVDGFVVFVAGAVPGDRVRARVFKKRKGFAEARLLEVLAPSDMRTTPRCEYFGTCGGCKWQHVGYEHQLEAKRESVHDALTRAGGLTLPEDGVRPTLGAESPYFYRNKMEFSFSAYRWLTPEEIATKDAFDTDFALGLHVPGNFMKVLDLKACYLQSELSVKLVNATREIAKAESWAPRDVRTGEGWLRHLVIRNGQRTGEVMVNLVTNGASDSRIQAYAAMLRFQFPEVTTLIHTINTGKAQTAYGEAMHTIYGPGVIHDEIGGLRFEIAPNAFFQTNTNQAERLYEVAREFADLKPTDRVFDLYCGAGTISLFLAKHCAEVLGVELVEEAVANARANAKANGITNARFVAGDMRDLFTEDFIATHGTPDVLVVDPPRAGMHPKVVERILAMRPERIVYVSCNPQSQARDLAPLKDAYRVDAVQPVDLFPQTHHVESVVRLTSLV